MRAVNLFYCMLPAAVKLKTYAHTHWGILKGKQRHTMKADKLLPCLTVYNGVWYSGVIRVEQETIESSEDQSLV